MKTNSYKPFIPQPPRPIMFTTAAEEFTALQRAYGLSEATIKGRERAARSFVEFAGKDLLCGDISPALIESYIQHLAARGLRKTTINGYMRSLSTVIKYGVSTGYVPNDFVVPKL